MSPSFPLVAPFPFRLILGSRSPRRQELLSVLGIPFEVIIPDIHEERRPQESPLNYVKRNATEKALAILDKISDLNPSIPPMVLSADTIGVLNDEVLEKPVSIDHAREMLLSLSGRTHDVITAFSLMIKTSIHSEPISCVKDVVTKVTFRELSVSEIEFYINTKEPFDKAGAYGIQGIGSLWVRRIEGSYPNVVGLPIAEVLEGIQELIKLSR